MLTRLPFWLAVRQRSREAAAFMKNFARALREAWRHWLTLGAGIGCSFIMAALWGANIAALFPVIETTINGESLQRWNERRIEGSLTNVNRLQAEWEEMGRTMPPHTDENYQLQRFKKDLVKTKLQSEQLTLASRQRLQPWLERFLPSQPFPTVVLVLCFVAFGTLLKQVFGIANVTLVAYVSQSIAREVRMRIFSKALTLDRKGFNTMGTSGFSACISQTTDGLAQGIICFYGGAIAEPLRILSCLFAAMMISWRVTLASLIFAPLMAMLMIWLNRRIRRLAWNALDRTLAFNHILLEVFTALTTVQAYTMEDFERERFRKSTKEMRRMGVMYSFLNALANPITEVFGISALCTGLAAAAYLVIHQETHIFGIPMAKEPMTVSELTVVFSLLVGATEPMRKLSGVFAGINSGTAAADLLYTLLDQQSQIADPEHPKTLPSPHRAIEFRDLTFSYDGQHQALRNVNLTIPFGERLAIVGPNGGGKSTLMNLLCRFFDPQQGAVLIDGIDIREVSLHHLRRRIAIVTQQSEFFNETVLHNIRYGRWDATDEEVIEAAKKAKAHDFISEFDQGYQTLVGPNGQRLSGGQRQRIALARAILRNAEILILDEATSQIDAESEKLIHDVLLEYGHGRTLIMITHRQSTLDLATRVIQIDRGELKVMFESLVKAA
jgi:ATP-binding cassette subfamily B protein/subfamily B ATP-binding cassette protein MsbA